MVTLVGNFWLHVNITGFISLNPNQTTSCNVVYRHDFSWTVHLSVFFGCSWLFSFIQVSLGFSCFMFNYSMWSRNTFKTYESPKRDFKKNKMNFLLEKKFFTMQWYSITNKIFMDKWYWTSMFLNLACYIHLVIFWWTK